MSLWFFKNSERLSLERQAVDQLRLSAEWLAGVEWILEGGLCLDAVIRAHGFDYEVRLAYPALFPDAPITVRPRNSTDRVSSHQYGGANGPLCLEWGADNWHSEVTAAQMLESAYRLFDIENPLGENRPEIPVVAPSRHHLSLGQTLRGEPFRWCQTSSARKFFDELPENSVGDFKFSFRKAGENWIILIHEATPLGGEKWKDDQIPTSLPGAESNSLDVGVWFKTTLERSEIGELGSLMDLRRILAGSDGEHFLATDGTSPIEGFKRPIVAVLIFDRLGTPYLYVVLSGEKAFKSVVVPADDVAVEVRSPTVGLLISKKIGIVGLGSAGSKIAVSLARMG